MVRRFHAVSFGSGSMMRWAAVMAMSSFTARFWQMVNHCETLSFVSLFDGFVQCVSGVDLLLGASN